MRKFFIASFFSLTLLAGAAGTFVPTATYAQTPAADPAPAADTAQNPAPAAPGTGESKPMAAGKDDDESFSGLMTTIMSMFAWLLGIAATTLNYSVYYTVIIMGKLLNGTGGLSAIGVTWQVLRDIGNIVLIFGFIAVGISTILNTSVYGAKQMLPKLLIVAVFLNFSLFISMAVIDVGNIFATEIYTQINGGVAITDQNVKDEGISNTIMKQLGFQSIYGDARDNELILKGGNATLIGFMGIILFMVSAFVMFSLAFMLIARFVILVFLIVVAPIGFAGLAIPRLEGTAGEWWGMLFKQTISAPVLLLMLYIALRVITDVNFLTGFGASNAEGAWTAAFANSTSESVAGLSGLMLSFLVAMGLLLMCTVMAQRMGAFGASLATKTAGILTGGAVVAGGIGASRLTGFAGRQTLGRVGRLMQRGGYNRLGGALANRTYDPLNVGKAVGKIPFVGGGITAAAGVAGGLVGQGVSHVADIAGAGDLVAGAKLGAQTAGSPKKAEEYREKALKKDKEERKRKLQDVLTNSSSTPAQIKEALKNMSTEEMSEVEGIRKGDPRLVGVLSGKQYKDLVESSKMLGSEKIKIQTEWNKQFDPPTPTNPTQLRDTMARLDDDEVAGLGKDILSKDHVIDELKEQHLDAMFKKGSGLSAAVRTAIINRFNTPGVGSPAFNAAMNAHLTSGNPSERAKKARFWV